MKNYNFKFTLNFIKIAALVLGILALAGTISTTVVVVILMAFVIFSVNFNYTIERSRSYKSTMTPLTKTSSSRRSIYR